MQRHVAYRIPVSNLLSARYLLSVSLADENTNRVFDGIQYVMEFHVTDEQGRVGWLELDGEWSHRSARARARDSGAVA